MHPIIVRIHTTITTKYAGIYTCMCPSAYKLLEYKLLSCTWAWVVPILLPIYNVKCPHYMVLIKTHLYYRVRASCELHNISMIKYRILWPFSTHWPVCMCIRILSGMPHFMLDQNVIFFMVHFHFPWLFHDIWHFKDFHDFPRPGNQSFKFHDFSRFSMMAWTLYYHFRRHSI